MDGCASMLLLARIERFRRATACDVGLQALGPARARLSPKWRPEASADDQVTSDDHLTGILESRWNVGPFEVFSLK